MRTNTKSSDMLRNSKTSWERITNTQKSAEIKGNHKNQFEIVRSFKKQREITGNDNKYRDIKKNKEKSRKLKKTRETCVTESVSTIRHYDYFLRFTFHVANWANISFGICFFYPGVSFIKTKLELFHYIILCWEEGINCPLGSPSWNHKHACCKIFWNS